MSDDFLGRGWGFPPTFNPLTNTVDMLEDEDDIEASLKTLLTTARGERVMLPLYGCNMQDMLFEPLNTRLKTLLADMIETSIVYHEPRITVESVTVNDDVKRTRDGKGYPEIEGMAVIEVTYSIKSTNSRFNFVYPFYLTEGTDVNLTSSVRLLSET